MPWRGHIKAFRVIFTLQITLLIPVFKSKFLMLQHQVFLSL